MLDLMYITHFHPGTQRTLAYAFGLAKALSSPLSLLPSTSLGEAGGGKMPIWTPKKRETRNNMRASNKLVKYQKRKKHLPLYILGKSNQSAIRERLTYQIIQRLIDLDFPTLVLPYNHAFSGIRNVLFAGNAPGLTDHRLKHFIAATFLPRAFQLENARLKRIHWNNISHIPRRNQSAVNFDCAQLKAEMTQHQIDLTIFPMGNSPVNEGESLDALQQVLSAKHPVLLLPLRPEIPTSADQVDYLQLVD